MAVLSNGTMEASPAEMMVAELKGLTDIFSRQEFCLCKFFVVLEGYIRCDKNITWELLPHS